MLKGPSVARRTLENPAPPMIADNFAWSAWAPRPSPELTASATALAADIEISLTRVGARRHAPTQVPGHRHGRSLFALLQPDGHEGSQLHR
jgi:hypothetical protein